MKHDTQLVKETADNQLLELGQDKIVYLSKLDAAMASNLVLPPELTAKASDLWGVYSASGDVLAICDSPVAAWEFANEEDLIAVRTH